MEHEEFDWLDESEASDQILLDQNSLRRMDSEWEPSEAENDAAVDEAVDPILTFIGDVQESAYDPDAPISTTTLLAQLDEVSVERRRQVAQTQAEFDELIKELDRLDRNRERRERYHEILQEEYIPQGGEFYSGRIFPAALDSPESKLILRDNYTKKLQKQLYGHLLQKKQSGAGLSFREKEFLTQYELALGESGTANVKVKKENKYPKRIRRNGAVNSTGTEVGGAV